MKKNLLHIDINADLGEGMPNDQALMSYISSCSIACGGHYGDERSMRTAIQLAQEHQVRVGAHPSYPDFKNFGRKRMELSNLALEESVYSQIMRFYDICDSENIAVNHIKLHGALYNTAAQDELTADAVLNAFNRLQDKPVLYLPRYAVIAKKAAAYFQICYEAFIDRRYMPDGSLVSRNIPEAVITDPIKAWKQLSKLVLEKKIETLDGRVLAMDAGTFCIHGDNPNAIEILREVHTQLMAHNIVLA